MAVTSNFFARTTEEKKDVYEFILTNKNGVKVHIIEYGASITKIIVPDKNGNPTDVVLGYDTLQQYEKGTASHGAFVGRVANRIKNSEFEIDGKVYHLTPNSGKHHLHGVLNKYVFHGKIHGDSAVFQATSPDGEDGMPGELKLTVKYTLTEENALVMDYIANTNEPTIINLTNHSYFNLNGHSSGDMLSHKLYINADKFTPSDKESCPIGTIENVHGTPMDFLNSKLIGQHINDDYEQIQMANGYDHNYVLNKEKGELALFACAVGNESHISMEMYTTQPGVQLYTGNYLESDAQQPAKDGAIYKKYHGFCMETQHFPCSTSYKNFPSIKLMPKEEYHQTTIYKFI